MKYLIPMLLLIAAYPLYAAVPDTIVCTPYENVWFDASSIGKDKIEHEKAHGKLNGKELEIIINFRKHFVMNRLGDKKSRESLMHAKRNVYYIKGKQGSVYYGAYTFDKNFRSAIYSADGAFATFLECSPYKVKKPKFIPRR